MPTPSTTTIPPTSTTLAHNTVLIRLLLDRQVDDVATASFEQIVRAALTNPSGWVQAGFAFSFDDTDFDYVVVLAEGPEVDRLCEPYRTGGRFSCQIGPVVALNADRWREAVPEWPASLLEYRLMLVNHEVGHLLGQHHPDAFCGAAGEPSAVMAQQSKGVGECLANPWPLPWEIVCASLHEEPLAPPYEASPELTCGPERAAAIDPIVATP